MADDDQISRKEAYRIIHKFQSEAENKVNELKAEWEQRVGDKDIAREKLQKEIADDLRAKDAELGAKDAAMEQMRKELHDKIEELEKQLSIERKVRLAEKDRLVTLEGGFRIFVVPRPPEPSGNTPAGDVGGGVGTTKFDPYKQEVTYVDAQEQVYKYKFDRVFEPKAGSTQHLWDECSIFVDGIFNEQPRHLLMMAHGRTGSGKTYIMAEKEHGMIPRTLWRIFDLKEQHEKVGDSVQVTAMSVQIYKGHCYNHQEKEIEYVNTGVQYVAHFAKIKATYGAVVEDEKLDRLEHAENFFEVAYKQRKAHTSATASNHTSSRSHLVVKFAVTIKQGRTGAVRTGSIHLVDLAGNEQQQATELGEEERKHIKEALRGLNKILPLVHARNRQTTRNQKQEILGIEREEQLVKGEVNTSTMDNNLTKALYQPLSELCPRLLIFFTLHSETCAAANKETMDEAYLWLKRKKVKGEGRGPEQAMSGTYSVQKREEKSGTEMRSSSAPAKGRQPMHFSK